MKIRELLEDGRIVKGVNTTVDVGVNQTKLEAAKFGNRVTRDGFPPMLAANGKISESLSAYQKAIIEGGHTLEDPRFSFLKELQDVELDEGIKDRLRQLALGAGMAATAAGGIATKSAYDKMYNTQPPSISQQASTPSAQKSLPKRPISATPKQQSADKSDATQSKLAPTTSIRPMPRPPEEKPARPKARPSLKNLGKYSSYLYDEAVKHGIKGVELVALMAQAAHETKGFVDLDEDGGTEYFQIYDIEFSPEKADELGNDQPGDGEKYKGRGFLHTTGKYNYAEVGNEFGMDFVEHPELLEDPIIGAKTSVWFWLNKVRPEVSDFENVRAVTRIVNPGMSKLGERKRYFREYMKLVSKFGSD